MNNSENCHYSLGWYYFGWFISIFLERKKNGKIRFRGFLVSRPAPPGVSRGQFLVAALEELGFAGHHAWVEESHSHSHLSPCGKPAQLSEITIFNR